VSALVLTDDEIRTRARQLGRAVEPLAANIYFAPEAHAAYAALGFEPSPGDRNGLHLPDGPAYFTSRGACLGQVPGEVVAAAFGVFNPAVVIPSVTHGWTLTSRDGMLAAREAGATASLRRILGDAPTGIDFATSVLRRAGDAATGEGRALFSGLRSLGFPGDPVGDLWRAADLVREHRGDSHIVAWVGAGLDPVEIGLLTEGYWGIPMRTYIFSRGWSSAQIDAAMQRLADHGLVAGNALTDDGRAFRDEVEWLTDRQERSIIGAIGDDIDELLTILESWAEAIRAANGYPSRVEALGRAGRDV
jgi:hypothetical protein